MENQKPRLFILILESVLMLFVMFSPVHPELKEKARNLFQLLVCVVNLIEQVAMVTDKTGSNMDIQKSEKKNSIQEDD